MKTPTSKNSDRNERNKKEYIAFFVMFLINAHTFSNFNKICEGQMISFLFISADNQI